ncbi:MAG: GNAT family N-acetyltransferase [Gammaproteobacteria bacterium]|nr:GNAT family N-acetyltransferase [Gammaproteobacteria bacterium]
MTWVIENLELSLKDYCNVWDRLNRDINSSHPFYDSRFIDLLLKHYGAGDEKLCIHLDRSDSIDGLLIVKNRKPGVWSLFLPSQAQIAPILMKNPEDLNRLLPYLPGYAILLEMLNQDPDYSSAFNLGAESPVCMQKHATTIKVDIIGDFDNYWKSRSKNLQKNIKRYRNRIESEGGCRIEVHTEKNQLMAALHRYGAIESAGWKGKVGTAIHADNTQGMFYLSLLQSFAEEKGAMVMELYIDDKLAASRLCINNDSILIILKTTFDEEYSAYAPGRVLLYYLLEMEFQVRRVNSVEFYTNATEDQIAWSTGQRSIEHISLFRSHFFLSLYKFLQNTRQISQKNSEKVNVVKGVSETTKQLVLREFNGFGQLTSNYQSLINNLEKKRFDLELDWFQLLSSTGLQEKYEVLLAGVENADGCIAEAVIPLMYQRGKFKLEALGTFYTSQFRPFIRSTENKDPLVFLFSKLRTDPRRFSVMDIHPLPYDDEIYEVIVSSLRGAKWKTFRYFCFANWYFPVDGRSFEEYSQTLPSVLRNTIHRKGKRFKEKYSGTFELYANDERLDKAISDYEVIYRSSWKVQEPFPDFIPGLIRCYAKKGQLRLALAYVNGEPAAAQIWIVSHGRAAIYKLAYDEKYFKLSVGTILTNFLMRHVIDVDRVKEVDYLNGDEAYKRDWMSCRREKWGIVAYNPSTIRGLVGIANENIRRALKFIIRRNK